MRIGATSSASHSEAGIDVIVSAIDGCLSQASLVGTRPIAECLSFYYGEDLGIEGNDTGQWAHDHHRVRSGR